MMSPKDPKLNPHSIEEWILANVSLSVQQICIYLSESGESCTPTLTHGSVLMHEGSVAESKEKIHLCDSASAI